jgi:hypothetical protein
MGMRDKLAGIVARVPVPLLRRGRRAQTQPGGEARGWVWLLLMLWVLIGADGTVYAFACTTLGCTTKQCTDEEFWFVLYNGVPAVIYVLGNLAEMAWPLLTVLLLPAGFVRLRGWRRRNWRRTAGWAGAWFAGIVLMALLTVVAGVGSEAPSPAWAAVELPIFAAWLALGAKMTSILAGHLGGRVWGAVGQNRP